MLSEIVKRKIEEASSLRIRYSKDCELLSEKIYVKCKCKLSASTLRRLFGFVKGTKAVRLHTLDVLANYLDYPTWDDLLSSMDKSGSLKPSFITELKSNKLKPGDRYFYQYKPDAEVTIEYVGKSQFKVIHSRGSQLKPQDIFKASVLSLHHPLFILEVLRDGEPLGKVIEAKVSGITSIKKI